MDLTREDKLYLGIGVAAAIAVTTIAIVVSRDSPKASPKKNYGLKVGPQCSTYELTDPERAKETVAELVTKAAAKGSVDPFAVTQQWLRGAAPSCTFFPAQVRNPGEAELFQLVFHEVATSLQEKNLISDDLKDTYFAMVDTWATSQGADDTVIT
jgi:hypothetical protein